MNMVALPPQLVAPRTRSFTAKLREHYWRENYEEATLRAKMAKCPILPIYLSLAMCGLIPVRLTRPHLLSGHLWRSSQLYCIITGLIVAFTTASVLHDHVPNIVDATVFMQLHERLTCANAILLVAPVFFIPILWVECSRSMKKATLFCKYEMMHEEITSVELSWDKLRVRNRKTVAFIYIFLALMFVTGYLFQSVPLTQVPTGVSIIFQWHITLWYITWVSQIRLAAESLLEFLQRIGNNSHRIGGQVKETNWLWIQLREVIEMNTTLRCLIALILVYDFLAVVLCLYQVFHYGKIGDFWLVLVYALICISIFVPLHSLCNESHRCTYVMNDSFIRVLDQISVKMPHGVVRRGLNLFYFSIIAKPAKTSLLEFTQCNRALFSTVVSATLTYLVVLVQFQSVDKTKYPSLEHTLNHTSS